jgi:hypothetical protein
MKQWAAAVPLYLACGFRPLDETDVTVPDGVTIPCTTMELPLA